MTRKEKKKIKKNIERMEIEILEALHGEEFKETAESREVWDVVLFIKENCDNIKTQERLIIDLYLLAESWASLSCQNTAFKQEATKKKNVETKGEEK